MVANTRPASPAGTRLVGGLIKPFDLDRCLVYIDAGRAVPPSAGGRP